MPANMMGNKKLDARPDRPDIRDREYQPPLKSLPPVYPPENLIAKYLAEYTETQKLILDQGSEGACTGYGLAAVINYLQFYEFKKAGSDSKERPMARVSPWMLYDLARRYDEWPGEDYEGSSCRGAMKGWFHHGVCEEKFWTPPESRVSRKTDRKRAQDGWAANAGKRPLGAYYRIDNKSIADMQAAIAEVGAIYVSADVHRGWQIGKKPMLSVLQWTPGKVSTGGHAFALAGYNEQGFIVQNSWGKSWGFHGFAILSYGDWLENGADAWVAVMGAEIAAAASDIVLSSSRVVRKIAPGLGLGFANGANAATTAQSPKSGNWPLKTTIDHALIVGHRGRPERVTVSESTLSEAIEKVVFDNPAEWFSRQGTGKKRLALYVHGGLNDLDEGILRTSVLGPYFEANKIYPVFAVWRSGFRESVEDIINGAAGQLSGGDGDISRGWLNDASEKVTDALDYLMESTLAIPGSSIWENMKKRCVDAAQNEGAMDYFADAVKRLSARFPGLELHLVGHSAGSIMIGSLLKLLKQKGLKTKTCSLYAPACTAAFALDTYIPALRQGTLTPASMNIDILSDKNERADNVAVYRKSLLYLVSRAFEEHKTPILGMEGLWNDVKSSPFNNNNDEPHPDVTRWRQAWQAVRGPAPRLLTESHIKTGPKTSGKANHGCFDNWAAGVSRTLNRIRGEAEGSALPQPVGNIAY